MHQSDRIQLMKEKAEAVQAVVSKINTVDDAFRYAVNLTRKQGGKTLTATGLSTQEQRLLEKQCETFDLMFLKFPLRPYVNEIHTALTRVDWAIAETGTLVLDSSSEDVRIATMLAETQIAIVQASTIKAKTTDLEDELNAIVNQDTASYIVFITGASRTADIERVLAIGVHGPQELHILVMEEDNT